MIKDDWDQYKDLKYYPNRVCMCNCDDRIKVKPGHKYCGIPKYINGHQLRGMYSSIFAKDWEQYKNLKFYPNRFCVCNCGDRIKVRKSHSWEGIPVYINGHQRRGMKNTKEHNERIKRSNEGKKQSQKTAEKIGNSNRGKKRSEEYKKKRSEQQKQLWQDSEWKEKQLKAIFKGLKLLPNKPEKFLIKLLQKLFSNQWKYIGDGKDKDSIIAGKCPDFLCINGQKKIIEFFGDYHHGEGVTGIPSEQHAQERINHFVKEGYQTLIIWEHELKNLNILIGKIVNFHSNKMTNGRDRSRTCKGFRLDTLATCCRRQSA